MAARVTLVSRALDLLLSYRWDSLWWSSAQVGEALGVSANNIGKALERKAKDGYLERRLVPVDKARPGLAARAEYRWADGAPDPFDVVGV